MPFVRRPEEPINGIARVYWSFAGAPPDGEDLSTET
jgi:hypothetical protein